ncbi:MAG: hypothetical protein NZM43_08200 [Saprospiraceae bacterium]|nr:hypothetical protein [Saprospiraceae bacterium]MDW8484290.1 hypothetical protein [Saprospiraceae bacterium]
MKTNVLLGALVVGLASLTCKNLQHHTSLPADRERASPNLQAFAPAPQQPNPSSEITSLEAWIDALPPATASHRAYLASAYWHLSMAVSPRGEDVQPRYERKWLAFRQDQTFDILLDGKVVDTGRWNWDATKNYLYLSCKDPYLNNSWAVKDLSFLMIWIGNTDLNRSGIQIKVQGHKQLPWHATERD